MCSRETHQDYGYKSGLISTVMRHERKCLVCCGLSPASLVAMSETKSKPLERIDLLMA